MLKTFGPATLLASSRTPQSHHDDVYLLNDSIVPLIESYRPPSSPLQVVPHLSHQFFSPPGTEASSRLPSLSLCRARLRSITLSILVWLLSVWGVGGWIFGSGGMLTRSKRLVEEAVIHPVEPSIRHSWSELRQKYNSSPSAHSTIIRSHRTTAPLPLLSFRSRRATQAT